MGVHIAGRLTSRAMLVKIKRDLENEIRGLLKIDGLLVGTARGNAFSCPINLPNNVQNWRCPSYRSSPLVGLSTNSSTSSTERSWGLARGDRQTRFFMTAPGVGPVTALCFQATIDDPARFSRSRSVGAYVGLTTRRYS